MNQVAPELALDFDAPQVSSREALLTLIGVFTGIFVIFKGLCTICPENPALPRELDVIAIDYMAVLPEKK